MTYPRDPQQPRTSPGPQDPSTSPEPALPPPPSYGPDSRRPDVTPASDPPPYGQNPYAQTPHAQPPYGRPPLGPPPYGQAPFGQLPPRKKPNAGVIAVVAIGGVLAVCLVLSIVGALVAINRHGDTTSDEDRTAPAAPAGTLNQPVRDGDAEFTVTTVRCGVNTITGDSAPKNSQQGQFCLVMATVKNVGSKPFGIEVDADTAYAASGKEYQADAAVTIAANDATLFLKDLEPGASTPVVFVWDLPPNESITKLKMYESLGSDGVLITAA